MRPLPPFPPPTPHNGSCQSSNQNCFDFQSKCMCREESLFLSLLPSLIFFPFTSSQAHPPGIAFLPLLFSISSFLRTIYFSIVTFLLICLLTSALSPQLLSSIFTLLNIDSCSLFLFLWHFAFSLPCVLSTSTSALSPLLPARAGGRNLFMY